MNLLKGFLIGAALCGIIAFGSSCKKQEPPAAPVVVVAPVPNVQPATVTADTSASTVSTPAATSSPAAATQGTQLEAMGAVKMAPSAQTDKVKPAKKGVTSKAKPALSESAAVDKAKANAARAECLRAAVDYKFAYDQRAGKISNWGSVITDGPCNGASKPGHYKAKATKKVKKSTQVGAKVQGVVTPKKKVHKTPAPAAK